ncbi:unnamed protein product [Rhizophagus irregularis]|nr:unnamed protein product [Rhizophagus irregularis]
MNWHNTLSITQSTTIASNAFSDIISELKEFTTFPIQKIHYNEMKLAFSYNAKLLDRSCIINEDLKGVNYLTSSEVHYLVILLNNGTYKCSSFSNTISDFSNSTDEVSKLNINQYASLKKQHLYYVNVQELTNQAKQIACKSCDKFFITLLEEYIDKKNWKAINL